MSVMQLQDQDQPLGCPIYLFTIIYSTAGAIITSSWPLGARGTYIIQKSSTKITTSYGLHSPNTWYELGFTIKRTQIRTYVAKMGGHFKGISSTSEISKYRRTWPLAILRHIPIALDTSGALGHPSKYRSRPYTFRNHITAFQTTFHT
jgi:hypothetical protein